MNKYSTKIICSYPIQKQIKTKLLKMEDEQCNYTKLFRKISRCCNAENRKKAVRRIAVWSKGENKVKLILASEIPDKNCNRLYIS